MASLIEELIAMQSKRQAPQAVQSDIGGMLGMLSQGMNAGQSNLNVASVLNNQGPVAQAAPLPAIGNMGSGIGKTLISSMLDDYMDEKKLEKTKKLDAENNAKTTAYLDKLPQGATPIERALYMAKGPTNEVRKMGIDNFGEITKAEGKPWSENATAEMKNIMAEGIQPGTPEFNQRMSDVNNRYKEITPYQQAQLQQSKQSGDLQNTKLQLELERNAIMDNRAMSQQERQAKLDENSQKQTAFSNSNKLMDDFEKSLPTKEFVNTTKAVNQINNIWKDVNASVGVDDQAGITSFLKTLDSASAVMGGEFARAADTQGWIAKAKSWSNKIKDGSTIAPETRQEFKDAAARIQAGVRAAQDANVERFSGIASRGGYDRRDIVGNYRTQAEDRQGALDALRRRGKKL